MAYNNVGTTNAGVFTAQGNGGFNPGLTLDADGVATGNAYLISELEKRDPVIRKPLTSVTYPRDIPISVGGGWADFASVMSVAYGITGGSGDSPVTAGGANAIPIVQASTNKALYKAHVFAAALRVMFQDMQRSNFVGRSLDEMLRDGVRLAYDKHMDENVYVGLSEYGTTGLINNADVTHGYVDPATVGQTNYAWSGKTPAQILNDVNKAITAVWAAAGYDEDAMPNHILLPYEQYTMILNKPVSDLATESILDYILKNNIATKAGKELFVAGVKWLDGAGADSTDRMVVYCNDERFIKAEELVPLTRVMTSPNTANVCYDTAYMANVTETEIIYPQTIAYFDGI